MTPQLLTTSFLLETNLWFYHFSFYLVKRQGGTGAIILNDIYLPPSVFSGKYDQNHHHHHHHLVDYMHTSHRLGYSALITSAVVVTATTSTIAISTATTIIVTPTAAAIIISSPVSSTSVIISTSTIPSTISTAVIVSSTTVIISAVSSFVIMTSTSSVSSSVSTTIVKPTAISASASTIVIPSTSSARLFGLSLIYPQSSTIQLHTVTLGTGFLSFSSFHAHKGKPTRSTSFSVSGHEAIRNLAKCTKVFFETSFIRIV
mmetsp:Transcript_18544/g.24059  ORF Transcript_18544/g.24059 Transcript_18544/m.24059 type:complete len:260 (+) Transcript_18544:3574-4353(+)